MTQNKIYPKIAITGGYASGKSTACRFLKERGYLVFSADKIFSNLLRDEDFILSIYKILDISPTYYNSKLYYDRKLVSETLFCDGEKSIKLNEFTHKRVYEIIEELYETNKNRKIAFEIPLLFEGNKQNDFDYVIVIYRNLEDRIKFGALRDKITPEQAELRIKNQIDYDNNPPSGHTYIYNNGSKADLKVEIERVIKEIERRSS